MRILHDCNRAARCIGRSGRGGEGARPIERLKETKATRRDLGPARRYTRNTVTLSPNRDDGDDAPIAGPPVPAAHAPSIPDRGQAHSRHLLLRVVRGGISTNLLPAAHRSFPVV